MLRFLVLVVLVIVCVESDDNGECKAVECVGAEYECVGERCYCADGYVPDKFRDRCVRCPGKGEPCFGHCCNRHDNDTLHCWHGTCQQCYDPIYGTWICRPSFNDVLLNSASQIAMGTALILGILATFVLIYRLCSVSPLRPLGYHTESRLSIGSLQVYVDERLRNAPPRYSRTAPREASNTPTAYINSGFLHDNSIPPPPYTADEQKTVTPAPTIHI